MLDLTNAYNFHQYINPRRKGVYHFTIEVTDLAKVMLGDTVKRAQQMVYYGLEGNTASSAIISATQSANENHSIHLRYGYLAVEFTNGKAVKFPSDKYLTMDEGICLSTMPVSTVRCRGIPVKKYVSSRFDVASPCFYYAVDVTDKVSKYFGDALVSAEQLIRCTCDPSILLQEQYQQRAQSIAESKEADFLLGSILFKFSGENSLAMTNAVSSCHCTSTRLFGGDIQHG